MVRIFASEIWGVLFTGMYKCYFWSVWESGGGGGGG